VLFQSSVQNPVVPLVSTAVLELHPDPLHVQLQTAAESAIRAGYTHLNVVPLFLLPGVHVMEDIPNEVAIAQAALGQQIAIHVSPHLGRHPQLTTLLTLPHDSPAHAARVLIAHGSRRSGSDAAVEAIAAAMAARPAYWSKPPSLETQILQLVKTGCCDIVILPYFLFPGGIVDAIAQQLEQLSPQFPYTKFYLAAPIGVSETLADLVIELTVLS
jgi:sirohydrochlorin ferrochelatase